MEESIENHRKRLIFRSWHRGTKEMDLLLGSFADKNVPAFNAEELWQYEQLLEISDPDLYNWIAGREEVPANISNPVLTLLKNHRYA